jgi:hypothetical protein
MGTRTSYAFKKYGLNQYWVTCYYKNQIIIGWLQTTIVYSEKIQIQWEMIQTRKRYAFLEVLRFLTMVRYM